MPITRRTIAVVGLLLVVQLALAKRVSHADEKVGDSKSPVHWSLAAIQRPKLPRVKRADWVRNGIDRFVLARLEREGIAPAAEAQRRTLIRRVTLDLLGLPPTLADIEAFLADDSPDAYERLVDRLLASPRYGERWARPWMDLCHYADSDGYLTDQPRPVAWRYRQWLVRALNRDLSFDRFTTLQLAGDLLPGSTIEEKIATGFLRQTLSNREGGADLEEFRVEQVVDRAQLVGTVWLGMTVGCARCHDHKYDPISQEEFYQLYAFFDAASADRPGHRQSGLAGAIRARTGRHERGPSCWPAIPTTGCWLVSRACGCRLKRSATPRCRSAGCCRRRSNTPLQALTLLNDPVFFEAAQHLAVRILREGPSDVAGRIEFAFGLCMARKPSEQEQQRLTAFLVRQSSVLRDDSQAAARMFPHKMQGVDVAEAAKWTGLGSVLLNLHEFITRD